MELVNVSGLAAGYTLATDKLGCEWIVLVAKGTFKLPKERGEAPTPLAEQVPLFMADEFLGDPTSTPPRVENDFALRKQRCDVVLNGTCYAPQGRPATKVPVGLKVGSVVKAFNVVGYRCWEAGALYGVAAGKAHPFNALPFSYANAYGGVDRSNPDPKTHRWYEANPVGLGFRPDSTPLKLDGQPLPNTEEIARPVQRWDGDYVPMSFGPHGRSWKQRLRWAGTYDAAWKGDQYPFLPIDFDDRYFQCAPEDQQCDFLRGGEPVVLLNLTPWGRTEFTLPRLDEPFDVFYRSGERKRLKGVVDTVLIEPDSGRFTLTLRASFPLRRSMHEVRAVELGRVAVQRVPDEGEDPVYVAKTRTSLARLVAEKKDARGWPREAE